MKQIQERGGAVQYHGQIGRAQTHYTVDDYPLMRRVFTQDLWPTLQEIVCFVFTHCRNLSVASLLLPVPLASMSHARVRANAFAQEKLRQRGIYVGAAPDLQQPLEAPVQARQARIDDFFPRAVQG